MDTVKRGSEYSLPYSEYQSLLIAVTKAGCFKSTLKQHAFTFFAAVVGLCLSFYILTLTDVLWIQLINAFIAAFFTVQLGLLGHALSHSQVFESERVNRVLAVLVWGLGCGLSEGRWFFKHSVHHRSPNHIGQDPDLEIPFVFSDEQAGLRSDFQKKYLFPYQHILFWIGLWFVYPYNILNSMRYLFSDMTWRSAVEMILIFIHYIVAIKVTFLFLPTTTAVIFNLAALLFMGIYVGSAFAPNHKGEDMLSPNKKHNWVHQITLTRNIAPSPIISYVLSGIECQIEHHLFPTMPRFAYPRAREIVKDYCEKNNIPYHETSWIGSLQQIHNSLKDEACSFRSR